MQATTQLSLEEGLQRKASGLAKVSSRGSHWLHEAREFAYSWARIYGEVASDIVLDRCPIPEHLHNNTAGALFSDPRFVFTGRYRPSRRPSAHGREIKIWKLKEKQDERTSVQDARNSSDNGN